MKLIHLTIATAAAALLGGAAYAQQPAAPTPDGGWTFEGAAACQVSGLHGYTFRARPFHPSLDGQQLPGLVTWADGE